MRPSEKDEEPVLVSACLAGVACRYDGSAAPHPAILDLLRRGLAVIVCPELLGGLDVPRDPCEIRQGRVFGKSGADVTGPFAHGPALALEKARRAGCRRAILKARSPSCGSGVIYDGEFSGRLIPGRGVLAALLVKEGFDVTTELDL